MGITNWFVNNLKADERVLTRDLISIAIADKEFSDEEKRMILDICQIEDISNVNLMDSIRNPKCGVSILRTLEDKKSYLMHLIRVMNADEHAYPLEIHIIEIIAKKISVSRLQLVSFVLDEIKAKNISPNDGVAIVDQFVKYFLKTGA